MQGCCSGWVVDCVLISIKKHFGILEIGILTMNWYLQFESQNVLMG